MISELRVVNVALSTMTVAHGHTRGYNSDVVGDDQKELYEKDGLVCDRKRTNGKDQLRPADP